MDSGNKSRRRFFARAAFAAFLGAAAAGIGFSAHAHGRWRRGEPFDPAKLDERLERFLRHLYVEIDASDAQQAKLGPIVKEAVQELRPLREAMRAARKEAIDLLARETVDRAAMEQLRTAKMKAADQLSRRMTQALADAAEVLTPLQRKQIAEHLARWRGRHG